MIVALSRKPDLGTGHPIRHALGMLAGGWPARIWAGLLGLAALALVGQSVIGFLRVLGYELSLVLAMLASVAAAHLGAWLVVRRRLGLRDAHPADRPIGPGEAVGAPWLAATLAGWALCAAPLGIALGAALFVRNCDVTMGLVYFAGFPLASVPLGAAAGVAAGLCLPDRFPRLAPVAAAILIVLGSAVWELVRFYTAPVVFFYDPFGGFASGQGWDRALGIGAPFIWYRVYNAVAFGALLLFALAFVSPPRLRPGLGRLTRDRLPLLAAAVAAAAAAVALNASGGSLGFRPTAAYAATTLGGDLVTEHLHVRYDKATLGDEALLFASDLEYRWDQLLAFFGGRAPRNRIAVWVYGSGDQKRRLFGTTNTDMAKPWRGEIHLGPGGFPHGVAMHEMAHVFAGEMASGPFNVPTDVGFYVSMGLVEGIAEAATHGTEGRTDELTNHEWSAAMRAGGFAPAIPDLVSAAGFLRSYPGTSYTVAGSFVRFLVEAYGIGSFAAVYGGASFERGYGKPVEVLADEWGKAVDGLALAPWAADVARFRFDRPSILHAVCYHEIPALSADAARLARGGEVDAAVAAYRKICTYEPDEPGHPMAIFRTFVAADRYADARKEAADIGLHPKLGEVRRLELAEELADLDWREGRLEAAAAGYATVARSHRSEGAARRLAVKRAALEQPPAIRDELADYLFEEEGRSTAVTLLLLREVTGAAPDFAAAHYLLGYRLAGLGEHERAIPYFEKALALGLPDPSLAREARWRLGEAYFRRGRLDEAATVFRALDADGNSTAVRLTAQDWLGRIAWWKANPSRACALPLRSGGRAPGA